MKNYIPLIGAIAFLCYVTGFIMADTGELPDPKYCETVHTLSQSIWVSLVIWGICALGFSAGYNYKKAHP